MEIFIPRHEKLGEGFSFKEKLDSFEHPGRRTTPHGYQSPASWISDLVALKKLIILCPFCRIKFNPGKHNYRRFYIPDVTGLTDGYVVNGKCDGCKQPTQNLGGGAGFVHEAEYSKTCIDPIDARRKARARAKAMNPYLYIQQNRRRSQ